MRTFEIVMDDEGPALVCPPWPERHPMEPGWVTTIHGCVMWWPAREWKVCWDRNYVRIGYAEGGKAESRVTWPSVTQLTIVAAEGDSWTTTEVSRP